jgi:hypothetical protein
MHIKKTVDQSIPLMWESYVEIKKRIFIPILFTLVFVGACSTSFNRTRPELGQEKHQIHSVLLLPPRIKAFEVESSGKVTKKMQWSQTLKNNFQKVLQKNLGGNDEIRFTTLPEEGLSTHQKMALLKTYFLFEEVKESIGHHNKANVFNYSFDTGLKDMEPKSDSFLLITAVEILFTTGTKVKVAIGDLIQAGLNVLILAGAIVSNSTPFFIVDLGAEEGIYLEAVLIDAETGSLLWFKHGHFDPEVDPSNPRDSNGIERIQKPLELFLEDFPLFKIKKEKEEEVCDLGMESCT